MRSYRPPTAVLRFETSGDPAPYTLPVWDPAPWTITRHDDPNHLGLFCDALPEHQMALITSDYAPSRNRPPALGAVTVAAASKPAKL